MNNLKTLLKMMKAGATWKEVYDYVKEMDMQLQKMYATKDRPLTKEDEPTHVYLSPYALIREVRGK